MFIYLDLNQINESMHREIPWIRGVVYVMLQFLQIIFNRTVKFNPLLSNIKGFETSLIRELIIFTSLEKTFQTFQFELIINFEVVMYSKVQERSRESHMFLHVLSILDTNIRWRYLHANSLDSRELITNIHNTRRLERTTVLGNGHWNHLLRSSAEIENRKCSNYFWIEKITRN